MRSLPYSLLFVTVVALVASAPVVRAQTPLEGTAISDRADLPHASGFVSRAESAEHLLNAIGAKARQAVVVSAKAQRKKVSGSFDLARPFEVLNKVSADVGLVWYSDNQSIYVYEASEQKNAVGRLRSTSVATLNDFLRKARLADLRYPVRGGGADGTFYVAGPPVYVDIVLNAARYLDDLYEGADASPHHVEVIKLEHSFVNGRRYAVRGNTQETPGMASTLAEVLQLGDFGTVIKQPAPLPAEPTAVIEEALPAVVPSRIPAAQPERASSGSGPARVMPYSETNSLIVRGTLTQIEQIKRLVAELDIPRKQIELSLWIIDIKKTELDRLGVRWSGGINIGNRLQIGINDGIPATTLDGPRFLASVQALTSTGDAQIVSRPVLLTQENVPAYFDSNQTFYTQLLAERTASLEPVTYGTLVNVRPRISTHDEVEMQLTIEDGAAQSANFDGGLPMVNRTLIDTVARVPHQLSLLIGGYTRQSLDNGKTGIPGLRRMPGVGKLFGQDTRSHENLVRVFLIQPRVLGERDMLDAARLQSLYGQEVGESPQDLLQEMKQDLPAMEAAHGAPRD
ncbi:type III secretion system outer membrane ring subunit SctC [Stenotrophomonas sp. PS02289]|uniref:type III secretion system outer membrane ring subunit SctC n=1 Tax=Stenotrophomonas sp. PS02289 TaxID=2991422 RepID=UPI00249BEFB0|nr:type III secretion system outer membrane ring subunit SctC [Stenotrophomonas sp. PS02289]